MTSPKIIYVIRIEKYFITHYVFKIVERECVYF